MANIKKKTKPIPLSMRGKKRYVYFELDSEKKPSKSSVSKALWNCFIDLYGSLGTAEIKFWFVDFHNGKGILRCAHTEVEKAKTAVLFMKSVDGCAVTPKILRVSGSLKKLKTS
ncbi:MAG: Rpp14/Pop5 family protein [Candidatus Diapherotrites archaeon]